MIRRPLFRTLSLAALVAASSCEVGTAVDEVRYPIDPPEEYRAFYAEAEVCAETSGDFGRVGWFWTQTFPGQANTVGQWNERREITLMWQFRFDRRVVVHEIIHDLLGGDADHLSPAWDACGVPRGS